MKLPNSSASLWMHTGRTPIARPPLAQNLEADVAIVGAGITGLTTAFHLARAGKSVVVIEGREVAR